MNTRKQRPPVALRCSEGSRAPPARPISKEDHETRLDPGAKREMALESQFHNTPRQLANIGAQHAY